MTRVPRVLSIVVAACSALAAGVAEAQFAADSPYCRLNPQNLACPPPVRVQLVDPQPQYEYADTVSKLMEQFVAGQRDPRDYELRRAEAQARIRLMEAEAARIADQRERERLESVVQQQKTDAAGDAAVYEILSSFVARHPGLTTETIQSMGKWGKTLALAPNGSPDLYLDALYVLAAGAAGSTCTPAPAAGAPSP